MFRVSGYIIVLLVLCSLLLSAGCANQPEEIKANLGQQFELAVGQTASIQGEELKLNFLEVVGDSRCPRGVTCIWAGEATCLVDMTYHGSSNRKTLVQPGLSGPADTFFNEYEISFNLQPYPEAGKEIESKDYRLQLTVKKQVLSGGILVTFDVVGQTYRIFITNQKTIDQVFAVQRGESRATIPSGRLVRGAVWYNQPWSWHIDSEDIGMAEVTIELCDGTPSQVEENLDYWVDTVRVFCPWSAKIVEIKDYR